MNNPSAQWIYTQNKKQSSITKTCLYNFDPLKPHFYIVKLRVYRGIHYFFLFLLKNIDCGYSLEPPRRGGSNEYPQSMFRAGIWKISEFFIWKFPYLVVKFPIYSNRRVSWARLAAPSFGQLGLIIDLNKFQISQNGSNDHNDQKI